MRIAVRFLVFGGLVAAGVSLRAQQPAIVHAELTTKTAEHGLRAELQAAERTAAPVWVGYMIPAAERISSGWGSDRTSYLEGDRWTGEHQERENRPMQDHAVVLLRVSGGAVGKLRVESPDREIDAGGLRVVWLKDVAVEDSLRTLKELALRGDPRGLRDASVFAISIHRSAETTPALVSLASPANELELREKAAFWLANGRGKEGFAALQRFAQEDGDARFREKLAFDMTLSKEPGALDELIRMAHSDASPEVRKQAQFWMASKGGKQVAGDLRGLAEHDPELPLRKSAVFALSRLPGDEAATQLIQVPRSSQDPEVRKQAVFWLGQSRDPKALEYLTSLLKQ